MPKAQQIGTVALVDILKRNQRYLSGILHRFRIDPPTAEDLLQEVALLALAKWDQIQNKEGWIARVLQYRCIRACRERNLDRQHLETCDGHAELEARSAPLPPPQERDMLLAELTSCLPGRPSRVLEMFREGRSSREIGHALGIKPESARRLLRRSLSRVRERTAGSVGRRQGKTAHLP